MQQLLFHLMAACLLLSVSSASLAFKLTYPVDIFFVSGAVPKIGSIGKLENLVCKISPPYFELVIAVGHASADEENPQKLSEFRAEKIKTALVEMGIPAARIYVDGKGSKQPVASPQDNERNRRVEIEAVTGGGERNKSCDNRLKQLMMDLPIDQALLVAHTQVKEKRIEAYRPAVEAISGKSDDLLEELLVGPKRIPLSREDKVELFHAAILADDTKYLRRLIRFGIKPNDFRSRNLPLIWAVCERKTENGGEFAKLQAVSALLDWGAGLGADADYSSRFPTALACAAFSNLSAVADELIARGASLDLPIDSPPILAASEHPLMVRKLVDAGANIKALDAHGRNLFHGYKFSTSAEVAWLASNGIDINALDKDKVTPMQSALRYASPEVLDAFIANGASLMQHDRPLIDVPMGSLAGLVWLIDKGVPLTSRPYLAHIFAARGEVAIPLMDALSRRGVDLSQINDKGDTPLSTAVNAYSPPLVKRLLELGAVDEPAKATVALRAAEKLQIRQVPYFCLHCPIPEGGWDAETRRLNTDQILADRQTRKNQIIDILKTAQVQR